MAFHQYFYKQPSNVIRGTSFRGDSYTNLSQSNFEDTQRYSSIHFPTTHRNVGFGGEDEDEDDGTLLIHIEHHNHNVPHDPHHRHHQRPRTRFVEPPVEEKKSIIKSREVRATKSIDDEADGFINDKHRSFALNRWNTYRI
ncbi:unnamed protein product [Amaranthus hypochondriacus]